MALYAILEAKGQEEAMQENTARLTTITPKTPQDGQHSADKPVWERQKHEPALWYMRFKRYLEMGTKRSLRAVYVAEPVAQKATKKQAATQKSLSDVSVPGSWTRAAKVWNWTTRAREYDLNLELCQGFLFSDEFHGVVSFLARVSEMTAHPDILSSLISVEDA